MKEWSIYDPNKHSSTESINRNINIVLLRQKKYEGALGQMLTAVGVLQHFVWEVRDGCLPEKIELKEV